MGTLQGTKIFHLGKRILSSTQKCRLVWDMLVPWRVFGNLVNIKDPKTLMTFVLKVNQLIKISVSCFGIMCNWKVCNMRIITSRMPHCKSN